MSTFHEIELGPKIYFSPESEAIGRMRYGYSKSVRVFVMLRYVSKRLNILSKFLGKILAGDPPISLVFCDVDLLAENCNNRNVR